MSSLSPGLVFSILAVAASLPAQELSRGEAIWKKTCSECHGVDGQGVVGKYDHPLTGLKSLDEVASLIEQTMPEQDPSLCVGEDARAVAEYLLAKISPAVEQPTRPRIELLHLTNVQYRNAIASLFDEFLGSAEPVPDRGLQARYFNSRGFDQAKKVEERIEPTIDVDWQRGGPLGDKTDPNEFCVQWEGSLFAPTSGVYRFIIQSPNGYRLFINRLNVPLLDSWVATINEPEKSAEIQLIGGRWYSLKFEFLKVKDPAVSVRLLWQPPYRAKTVVPQSVLMPITSRPVMLVQTPFPADDSNLGYRRGALVSNEWDQATTDAAIEVAAIVAEHLPRFVGKPAEPEKLAEAARKFCVRIAERAFRRSLNDELRGRYIENFFQQTEGPADAVKGSLTTILKSPLFLYVGLDRGRQESETTAERLAWALTDTLPTRGLETFIASANARNTDARRKTAEEILFSPAGKLKWQQFFVEWLKLDETGELSKDQETFAGFDELLVNDLQESLLRFVDEVLWGEEADFRKLLLADHLWLNERLARFYSASQFDVNAAGDNPFQKVGFDPRQRAGLLTHPLMLSHFSYFRSTSPIHRGVFVSRKLMGIALKPPPVAVEPLGEDYDPHMTTRERVEFQTRPDNCMSCHRVINPLGFALESLDAVGRPRTTEKDKPIDATGELTMPEGESIKLAGPRQLAEFLVGRRETHRHFVETVFHHAVQQPVAAYGEKALDELTDYFIANGYNIRKLIAEIAWRTATFQPVSKEN